VQTSNSSSTPSYLNSATIDLTTNYSILPHLRTLLHHSPPQQYPRWQPDTSLPKRPDTHPFLQLTNTFSAPHVIPKYTLGSPRTTIDWLARTLNIHITVQDLRDLVSPNCQIYHELIIMSLKVIYHKYDPSFITMVTQHNWESIANRLTPQGTSTISWPELTDDKIVTVAHIDNNLWVALCQHLIHGKVTVFYLDDLNNPMTEVKLKRLLFSNKVSREFCPRDSH
jgi:hypothetical protein